MEEFVLRLSRLVTLYGLSSCQNPSVEQVDPRLHQTKFADPLRFLEKSISWRSMFIVRIELNFGE